MGSAGGSQLLCAVYGVVWIYGYSIDTVLKPTQLLV